MSALFLVVVTLAAPAVIPVPAAPPATAEVEAFLGAHPEFLHHHTGYLIHVQTHPALASVEPDWWSLNSFSEFYTRVAQFDEALAQDENAQRAFDAFYSELARDGELKDAIGALQDLELADPSPARALQTALQYFRLHPEVALRALERAAGLESLNHVVQPLREYAEQHPEAVGHLRDAFRTLAATPQVQERLAPWWAFVESSAATPYRDLLDYFVQHPAQFSVWHQRNLALAADPHAAEWIRWWERRVRRKPQLERGYFAYLAATVGENKAAAGPAGDSGKTVAEHWPRAGSPPPLPALPPVLPEVVESKELRPWIERPLRPEFHRPELPERPNRPALRESTRFPRRREAGQE
ncbi:MAG: hypothetical protein HYV26_19720 [Candidatus Hydrogenedentes bacterium]|nr:hypothetical protein [Candidatus Hydrogenedentota bacterium]